MVHRLHVRKPPLRYIDLAGCVATRMSLSNNSCNSRLRVKLKTRCRNPSLLEEHAPRSPEIVATFSSVSNLDLAARASDYECAIIVHSLMGSYEALAAARGYPQFSVKLVRIQSLQRSLSLGTIQTARFTLLLLPIRTFSVALHKRILFDTL